MHHIDAPQRWRTIVFVAYRYHDGDYYHHYDDIDDYHRWYDDLIDNDDVS